MIGAIDKIRDYIALIMTLGMLIFVGFKLPIPDRLWDVYLAIVMFFFGSKQTDAQSKSEPTKPVSSPVSAQISPIIEVKP